MTLNAAIHADASGICLAVRAVPRARRTAFAGLYGEGVETRLKIALAAPPVDSKANEALMAYLAEVLRVPRAAVSLVGGGQSRNKRVRIAGLSLEDAISRLAAVTG